MFTVGSLLSLVGEIFSDCKWSYFTCSQVVPSAGWMWRCDPHVYDLMSWVVGYIQQFYLIRVYFEFHTNFNFYYIIFLIRKTSTYEFGNLFDLLGPVFLVINVKVALVRVVQSHSGSVVKVVTMILVLRPRWLPLLHSWSHFQVHEMDYWSLLLTKNNKKLCKP